MFELLSFDVLDRDPVVLGPLFDYLDHVLHLWVGGVPQDGDHVSQGLPILTARDNGLKPVCCGSGFKLDPCSGPLWIRIRIQKGKYRINLKLKV